jgi:hypothetical protein
MEGIMSSSTVAAAIAYIEALEAPVALNVSVPNSGGSQIDGLIDDLSLLRKYGLPPNYHAKHDNMVDTIAKSSKKRAYDSIAEASSILESFGLSVCVIVVNSQTGEAKSEDSFFSSPAMGILLKHKIGNKGEIPNEKMTEVSLIARGFKPLFSNVGNSRQRSSDSNLSNGDSRETFMKELVRNYHRMYTKKNKKHNDVSTSAEGSLESLEEQLISFYKKGYYLEMSIIEHLCSPRSLRRDKTMPIFGCDVDPSQHHLLPVHAPREHRDIMSEWHRLLLTGKARIKKDTDSEAQHRVNGRFAIVDQPSESSIESTVV